MQRERERIMMSGLWTLNPGPPVPYLAATDRSDYWQLPLVAGEWKGPRPAHVYAPQLHACTFGTPRTTA